MKIRHRSSPLGRKPLTLTTTFTLEFDDADAILNGGGGPVFFNTPSLDRSDGLDAVDSRFEALASGVRMGLGTPAPTGELATASWAWTGDAAPAGEIDGYGMAE